MTTSTDYAQCPSRHDEGYKKHIIESDDALSGRSKVRMSNCRENETAEAVHDFRNILNMVSMLSELALLNLPETSPVCGTVRHIKTACSDANDLCNRMMENSRSTSKGVEWVNLSTLVRAMAPSLATYLSGESALRLDLTDDLPLANASSCEIRQVVVNLVKNATESLADQPGTVTVSTGVVEIDTAGIGKGWCWHSPNAGQYSYLSVADSGCGMDEETAAHLFESSFTTKADGHGLGTASIRRIVRGCDGFIQVQSQLGVGTQIRVLFPLSQVLDPALSLPFEL